MENTTTEKKNKAGVTGIPYRAMPRTAFERAFVELSTVTIGDCTSVQFAQGTHVYASLKELIGHRRAKELSLIERTKELS